ncbi:MAG: LytTR family DNA-binding domain-containing protein, partial [Pseudomonadota bacterium]
DYAQIRSDGRNYLKNQSLSELEQQLPAQRFVRIHRSYIVNIERVSRIEQATRGSHVAILHDGSRIPVSRNGYQKLRAVMQ